MRLSEITPAIIEGWKTKYKDVYQITANGKTGYFRELNKRDLTPENRKKLFVSNDVLKTAFNTLKVAWLGGDIEFLTNDDLAMFAFNKLEFVFEKNAKRFYPHIFNN